MNRALIRLTVAVAVSCALIAGGLAAPAQAAAPAIPAANIIVIPGPDQVGHVIDGTRCPWVTTMTAALSGPAAPGQPAAVSPLAMLVLGPMVAASYSGMLEG